MDHRENMSDDNKDSTIQNDNTYDNYSKGGGGQKKGILKFIAPLLVLLAFVGKVLKPLLVLLKFSKFGATFVSMFITVIVYSAFFGWKFALGFVILLLIHENGHLMAARRTGLPVSRPIFIPFVGAFISMKEMPKNARQEAIIGLGGPLLGGLASLACFVIYDALKEPYWLALGYTGCFLNLFNLVPLGFLDGGRIATAISLWLWIPGAVILGVLAFKIGNPVIFLVLILGLFEGYKVFKNRRNPEAIQYYTLDSSFRLRLGLIYLGLLAVLGTGMGVSLEMLESLRSDIIVQGEKI
ncbi:membrane metalloprotease [Desulfocucumis palustris]|uniref:Membrane metalloprotease n=1 Tax=Desulfocucumis palustris TaxID=1898651 RepID=A0A2L2XHY2_9FIRM|nr:site-2 protease family protein [Desulfocucumis palustris]GBF33846.1 membrane metalloprotease [Desulfocucumis palustris]